MQLLDGTNVQHLLDMGPHIIIHVRRYMLVMLLEGHPIHYLQFCVWLKQSYPGLDSCRQTGVPIWAATLWPVPAQVWASPWGLGDPGPPRPIAFEDYYPNTSEVLVGRTTNGTCLAATTWPTTFFVGILMEWVPKLHRQMGTLKDPGCKFSIGYSWHHCCRQLGTWHWLHEHMDPHTVSSDTGIGMHMYCAKWGDGDLLYGALDLWHHPGRIPSPPQCHASGRNGSSPFPPQICLSLCEVVVVTQTWQPQNQPVSRSWLLLQVPLLLLFSWPYL